MKHCAYLMDDNATVMQGMPCDITTEPDVPVKKTRKRRNKSIIEPQYGKVPVVNPTEQETLERQWRKLRKGCRVMAWHSFNYYAAVVTSPGEITTEVVFVLGGDKVNLHNNHVIPLAYLTSLDEVYIVNTENVINFVEVKFEPFPMIIRNSPLPNSLPATHQRFKGIFDCEKKNGDIVKYTWQLFCMTPAQMSRALKECIKDRNITIRTVKDRPVRMEATANRIRCEECLNAYRNLRFYKKRKVTGKRKAARRPV